MNKDLATLRKSLAALMRTVSYLLLSTLYLPLTAGIIIPAKAASADNALHIAIVGDSHNANQRLLSDKTSQTLKELGLQLQIDSLSSAPFIKSQGCDKNYDLIIPVGNDITKQLLEKNCQLPIISVLTPSFGYSKIVPKESKLSAIFIDQPASRYISIVKALAPDNQSVSLIYSDYSEKFYQQLMTEAETEQLTINARKIDDDSNLYRVLEQLTDEGGILLAVPDPYVYNRKTIKAIFLASYQSGVPIIGFSEAYTKAGAIASIHSDIDNIAKQLAEGIYSFYQNDNMLPDTSYPQYFNVSTNPKVANSLGLNIKNAEEIHSSISKPE